MLSLTLIFMQFIAFPNKQNALLAKAIANDPNSIRIDVSGSMGLYYSGKCHQTNPNQTIISDKKMEWCSNIGKSKDDKPWISYSIKNKKMKLTSYAIRNGCCWYGCCCIDDKTDLGVCCCELFSFSLHGSNDNITWKLIHKVEREKDLYYCTFKTYDVDPGTEPFRYLRIVQDEQKPNCPFCMQINQVEFYGKTIDEYGVDSDFNSGDEDESVSIIGKIRNTE